MNFKKLIQMRRFYVILTFALLICNPFPTFADSDSVDVTVTISEMLCIEYVPTYWKPEYGDDVVFIITLDDMIEESVSIVNHGDIEWCSSTPDWKVTVYQDPWTTTSGSDDFGWYLQVKWGPPDNDGWGADKTVPIYPDTPLDWYRSWIDIKNLEDRTGTGTIEGIDWKIKDLKWEWTPPGSHWTTVYFTIWAVDR